jgi:hypothetical protein
MILKSYERESGLPIFAEEKLERVKPILRILCVLASGECARSKNRLDII